MSLPWIKHFTSVENSDAVARILDDLGMQGYGRYWRLLELLGRKLNNDTNKFTVTKRDLRECLRFSNNTQLGAFLESPSIHSVVKSNPNDNHYEIETDILSELQHRDFNKARQDRAKRKTKEIEKEKEIYTPIVPKDSVNPNDISDMYNAILGKSLPVVQKLSDKRKKKLRSLTKSLFHSIELWEGYFNEVAKSKFLLGSTGWAANFDWLLKEESAVKVMEGNYLKTGKMSVAEKIYRVENPYGEKRNI